MKTANASEKMDELYKKLLTFLYERPNTRRARSIADRLSRILSRLRPEPVTIFVEECRSLVSEAKGDLANAIKYRENEIRLIRQLHKLSNNTDSEDFVHSQYDYEDLGDRLNMLATLYHESGDLETAIRTLQDSKQLCLHHDLVFDWDSVLQEYLKEKERTSATYFLLASENGVLSIKQKQTSSGRAESLPSSEDVGRLFAEASLYGACRLTPHKPTTSLAS